METLIEIIRNRPALFIRYACYICFALYCIITTVSKKHKGKHKDEKQGEIIVGLFDIFKKKNNKPIESANQDVDNNVMHMKKYAVNIYLGKDKVLRFLHK